MLLVLNPETEFSLPKFNVHNIFNSVVSNTGDYWVLYLHNVLSKPLWTKEYNSLMQLLLVGFFLGVGGSY